MNETFLASSFKFEDDEPQGKSFSADSFKFDDNAEKPSEGKKDEKPSIPDIPRGFSPTIDMANDVAEEAQRRAAEEPKFKTRKERKSRMVSGTQVSTYGAVPTMEGYDADTVDEITDTKGNVAKRGDLFGVERKDGTSRLYEFTGDDEKGHPTFRRLTEEEANGKTAKASMSGDVFRRMRGEGRIKMDSSAIEQVRQGVLSETGREDVYGEGALGQLAAVATRAIPYIGRGNADRYKWQLQKLDEMSRGDFGGKDYIWLYKSGIFDDDKVNAIRTKDESEEDWQKRMQAAATDELKKRVTAMQDAEEELGATDKGAWDKILGGFIDSSGYALEFAVPGGAVGKGVKGWNVIKGGGLLAKIGNAAIRQNVVSAPVTLAEASSRYTEMRTPGFAIDEDGNPYIRDMVDSPGAAALKSIGGALFDTNVEIGLEPVAMGMFRLGKRTAGMAFDKWTPQLMEGLAKNYGKFAHSSTGRLMHDFAKAYGEFADVTAINSPLGELAEEDVQALERVFNLDGKTSEYERGGGFAAEWSRFKNDQMSAKTQFDTFLGLVGQLLVGSAVSAYRTHGYRNSEEYQEGLKQERDLKGVLRLANVSEDTINSLSPEQMAVLGDMWKRYSANPDELKKNTRGLGLALRAAGVEMANRDGVRFRDSLEADGIEPEKFVFQGDESGRPVFKGITRIHGDNKTEQMDAMSDGKHGVTIVDNHDGTYSVMNDWRGSVPSIFNDFDRARAEADNQVMLNQRMDGDNERKAAYFEKYVAPNYEGRSIHVVQTVQQLREEVLQGVTQGGEEGYFGARDASSIFDENGELREKSAGGFHTPDGTTVLILDNIVSPADMERVTAHEAVGHEGVEGQVGRDEVVEFIGGVRAKDFSGFANGIWRKMTQDYIRKGYSTEEAQQMAADICDSDRGRKEIMAKYAEQRRHLPTDQELKQHDENEKRRAAGEDVPTDDADLEVMLWKAEQEARQSNPDKKHTKAGAVSTDVETPAMSQPPKQAAVLGTRASNGEEDVSEEPVYDPEAKGQDEPGNDAGEASASTDAGQGEATAPVSPVAVDHGKTASATPTGGTDFDTDLTHAKDDSDSPKIEIRNWHDVKVTRGSAANDERIFDLFKHFNRNDESKTLAEKVFPLARKLNFTLYTEGDIGDLKGWQYGDIVAFNADWLSDTSVRPQEKADTILHEFIHRVTTYAIDAVSGRIDTGDVKLSKELREAVEDLSSIYEQTEKALGRKGKTNYAQTFELDENDPDASGGRFAVRDATQYARLKEFLAELSNPDVRKELKKLNLWERTVNGIRRVIKSVIDLFGEGGLNGVKGGDVQRNALDVALENLDKFLDNLDYRLGGESYYDKLQERKGKAKGGSRKKRVVSGDGVNYKRSSGEVDFDTKTPSMSDVAGMSEEEQDKFFGFTNDDVRFRMEALGMKPSKDASTTVDAIEEQAEFLLSNTEYMKKLVRAVAQWNYGGRTVSAAESAAIGKYYVHVSNELNADKWYLDEIGDLVKSSGELAGDQDKAELANARKTLKDSLRWFDTVCKANKTVGSNAGLTLMSRRIKINANDHSFAGIVNSLIEVSGGARADGTFKFPDSMIETASEIAKKFEELEGEEREFFAKRWRAYSEKVFSDVAKAVRVRKAAEKSVGAEAKAVTERYLDALTQVEVHSREGNSDIAGLDPKWLRSIAEWHCFQRHDITESEMVAAMREDISPFFPEVTDDEIRRAYTQYGHHFKQSKRESQAIMADRRAQSLKKLQIKTMREAGHLPPATGMIRNEPSDDLRALNKEAYEAKKQTPEGAANSLKSVIESIKRRLDNQIADIEKEIATGELIPSKERKVVDDVEIIRKRSRLAELRKQRDEIFGLHKGMTEEQRVKAVERALASSLEHAAQDLDRARAGDFSRQSKPDAVRTETANRYRDKIAEIRREIQDLKRAKYEFGMTPEEIDALNRRRIESRRKALERKVFDIESGVLPEKRVLPPMTPEQKKVYDELERQNRRANQRLRDLRLAARDASLVAPVRWAKEWAEFVKNIIPGTIASFDRSAPGRQGLTGSTAHPKWFLKDMRIAEKAAWNKDYFDEVNEGILTDPDISEAAKNYGLFVRSSDIDYQHDIEMFHGRNVAVPYGIRRIAEFVGQIPAVGKFGRVVGSVVSAGIENSERHYVTYLNLMTAQLYKSMLRAAPNATEWEKRQFAFVVNIATGAGGMSKSFRRKIQAANDTLGHLIWSPNLVVTQWERRLFLDVLGQFLGSAEGGMGGGRATKDERLAVLKEATTLRVRSMIACSLLGSVLAYMFAPDDWWDEWKRKSWYGKMSAFFSPLVGNAHIDLLTGDKNAGKMISRVLSPEYQTTTGKTVTAGDFGTRDFYSELGRYIGSKLSPQYGNVVSLLQKRDYVNDPFGWKEFFMAHLPLTPRDMAQIAVDGEWGDGEAPVAMVAAFLGMGGSMYEEPFFARTVNAYLENTDNPRHEKAAANRAYYDASDLRKREAEATGAEAEAIRKERESIESAVKAASRNGTPMRNVNYRAGVAAFKDGYKEWREVESDENLTDEERKSRLSKIEAENPLLKDGVRDDLMFSSGFGDRVRHQGLIPEAERIERQLKKAQKSGDDEGVKELEKELEEAREAVMKVIRSAK